jgi:hypothetical protein
MAKTKTSRGPSGKDRISHELPKIGKPIDIDGLRVKFRARQRKYGPLVEAILALEEDMALPVQPSPGETQESLLQRMSSVVARLCQGEAEDGMVYRVRATEDGNVHVTYAAGKRRAPRARSA